MEFCTQCGSRLVPKRVSSGKQDLVMLACTKCSFKKPDTKAEQKVNGIFIEHNPKQFVAVISKEEQLSTLPSLQVECPRCGNNVANVWEVQTRGSDESSTQFFRCVKCGYTFREYA